MRDYIKKRGIVVGPEQLELIVPAFELAWKMVESRGGFLLTGGELTAVKDRVAKTVVELVTSGDWMDAADLAAATVHRITQDAQQPRAG